MSRTLLVVPLTLVLALGAAAPSPAGLITPAGLKPGDQFRIVFLTDGRTDALAGSLAPYDGLVSAEATAQS